ncbi:MAG: zinc ABC transporter substrate-binding protein [Chthoniobacterales bacterium]|nr:zinc ABC transporter substrate-binding protein [Chthoniobacterales bacterium]
MITHSAFANHMKIKLAAWLGLAVAAVTFAPGLRGAEPLRVVTTFYPVYVATLNVAAGVDGVTVENLASPHVGCLHDYQLTAGDVRKLSEADLLLANGAGMESFLGKIARQSPGLRIVEVSEGIPLTDGNAHVWVSFDGARRQAANIAAALSSAAPEKSAAFRANADSYKARLGRLEEKMRAALAPFAGTPIVTFHEAFPYFARDFKLEIAGVVEPEPGTEPSARELADMVDLVRTRRVKALFTEPQFSGKCAQIIASETGSKVYELDPVVTGPSDPGAAKDAWLAAMEKNLAVLQEALR